jgi:hypothetical protein
MDSNYAEELGLVNGSTKLWVVMGTSTVYKGRNRVWPVAVYFAEEQAKKHVAAVTAEEKRLRDAWLAEDEEREYEGWRHDYVYNHAKWRNVFDPNVWGGDGDPTWSVEPVTLRQWPPTVHVGGGRRVY